MVGQGVGKRDGGAEAFDRSVDVGVEKNVMLAIGEQDQGGAGTRAEDGETGVV